MVSQLRSTVRTLKLSFSGTRSMCCPSSFGRYLFSVAFSFSMSATTICPGSACSCLRMMTRSPLSMPAFIMDSPSALSAKKSPPPNQDAGTCTYSSMFSSAYLGIPQETAPRTGSLIVERFVFAISFVAIFPRPLMSNIPFSFMWVKYLWTVVLGIPRSPTISLIEGE